MRATIVWAACLVAIGVAAAAANPAGAEAPPAVTKDRLVGEWDAKLDDFEQTLTLRADDTFDMEGSRGAPMSGKWALVKENLVLTSDAGLRIASPVTKLTDTQLTIKLFGAQVPVTYTKRQPKK